MRKPKRHNDKRKCAFCKGKFSSQRTYNRHVNTCSEVPPRKRGRG
jgi:hypothetical protein